MDVVGSKDIEGRFPCLVSDTVSNLGSNHHLDAVHVVKHYIVKRYFKCVFVNYVKVDLILRANLEPDIVFSKVDKASYLNNFLNVPLPLLCFLVKIVFEDCDIAWCPRYQELIEHNEHLPEVLVCDLLYSVLGRIMSLDSKSMPLSVKWIHLIPLIIVKAFIREIFLWRFDSQTKVDHFSYKLASVNIVVKMEVLHQMVMIQVNED